MKTSSYLLFAFALFIFVSCSGEPKAPQFTAQTKINDTEVKKEAWQMQWDKTLIQARKEGRVTIYTDIRPTVRDAWIKNFKDRFGVDIEFVAGRGAVTSQKLLTERKAGIYTGDITISGLTTLYLVLEPAGLFEDFEKHLFLPDVLDTKAWYDGHLPWFTEKRLIFLWRLYPTKPLWVNTQFVKPGEIKSYRDLLKPQWKGGKFVLNDPTISGSGSKWFEVYVREQFLGIDYMKSMVKQEPIITRDLRLGAEWVAMGKYPLSIGLEWSNYEPFVTAGAPLDSVETEVPYYLTSGSANLAWLKDAPHPNAAKLFVNWLLSKEGQLLAQQAERSQSAREDTGIEDLEVFRKKGVKYFNANTEDMYNNLEPLKQMAKEIFGPLVK